MKSEADANGRFGEYGGRFVPETLVAALDEIGAEPLVAPEVFSAALLAEGPEAMARRVVDATRATLSRS